MPDTPAPVTATASNWKVAQGVIMISILAFATLAFAALGWHAGVALARLVGI